MNASNDWQKLFEYLSVVEEEETDPTSGTQTIHVYSYFLEEVGCYPSDYAPAFKDSYGNVLGDGDNPVSFTTAILAENVRLTTDILLKKVDVADLNAENPETLKSAAFKIEKYMSDGYQEKDTTWGTGGEKAMTDDGTGTFRFDGLTTGFYKIIETALPPGYIKYTVDPRFKVELSGTSLVVTLLDDSGNAAEGNATNVVRVVPRTTTIVLGNTPGTALPQTGGSGTALFTALGGLMSVISGAILTMKSHSRKKEKAYANRRWILPIERSCTKSSR